MFFYRKKPNNWSCIGQKRTTLSVLSVENSCFFCISTKHCWLYSTARRITQESAVGWRQRPTINERAWHMTVTLGVPSALVLPRRRWHTPHDGVVRAQPFRLIIEQIACSRAERLSMVLCYCCSLFTIIDWINFRTCTKFTSNVLLGINFFQLNFFPGIMSYFILYIYISIFTRVVVWI